MGGASCPSESQRLGTATIDNSLTLLKNYCRSGALSAICPSDFCSSITYKLSDSEADGSRRCQRHRCSSAESDSGCTNVHDIPMEPILASQGNGKLRSSTSESIPSTRFLLGRRKNLEMEEVVPCGASV